MLWFLFVLLVVLSVAVAVLVVVGRRASASQVRSAIAIDRPAAAIWPWLTQPARLTQWVGWLEEVREVETGDEQGVGAVAIFVMNDPQMKETAEVEVRVLAVEAPRRLDLELEAPVGYVGAVSYTLEETTSGATELACTARYALLPALARLMEPLATRQARRRLREDLARLRELVDREATADLATVAETAEAAPPQA